MSLFRRNIAKKKALAIILDFRLKLVKFVRVNRILGNICLNDYTNIALIKFM